MVLIEETDFISLEDFPLRWRWTDSRWNKLPDEAVNSIYPFAQDKAHEIFQYSLSFCDGNGLFDSEFDQISTIDAQTDSPDVWAKLRACSAVPNQRVIVSWDHQHAVVVDWDVFAQYWSDFCYPGSDDVTVFPLSNEWALQYLHNEVFVFGMHRRN